MLALQQNDVFAERYLLRELVDSQGVSEVWVAEDLTAPGALEAIKIFAPQHKLDKLTLKLLRTDLENLRVPSHPHLLTFYRFEVYQDIPYVVMPYMPDGSLSRRLQQKAPFSEREIALLLKHIGSALSYLHAAEPLILHQNIKPDNILITPGGEYVLADFGISIPTRYALQRAIGQTNALPATYAPPEQMAFQPASNKAGDIFSLGVVIYQLCTGKIPWIGSGVGVQQDTTLPSLPDIYPQALSNLIKACMDPNVEKRPTAQELEAAGTYYLVNGTWKVPGKFGKGTRSGFKLSVTSVLVALAVLIVGLSVAYIIYENRKTPLQEQPALAVVTGTPTVLTKPETPLEKKEATPPAPKTAQKASPAVPVAKPKPQEPVETKAELPSVEKPKETPAKEAEKTTETPAKEKETTEPATAKAKPAATKKKESAEKKPATLNEYLSQLLNSTIPIEKREKWRADILAYFTPDAVIDCVVGDTPLGKLTPGEFVDILLSADSANTLQIDNIQQDDNGKVQDLKVHLVQPDSLE
ncbi:serine/threonine-protein kinase [Pontibacter liquoris]|uniref:serine/threonine-protein kinase n=1 Tax=Pontibacter liquoris TaxID=2905677 RepID=UPI001FA742B4|nr:serine/threonine-protein kinase [Pontibacter liquoris]